MRTFAASQHMDRHTKAYIAYAAICLIWGTTYLAISVAVTHYPPFLMAGARQFLSGLIILPLAFAQARKADLSRRNLLQQAFIGFLLITMGNGLVTWAEQYVESGVAALICSTMPISSVLLNILRGKEKWNGKVLLGMILGFTGVALVCSDKLQSSAGVPFSTIYLWGIAALFTATVSWAYGSLLNKTDKPRTNGFFDAGLQVLFGGLFMLLLSPGLDDYTNLQLWNADGFWAFAYLVVFGSVLAYTAYIYALKVLPVGFVMSYAYINPLVAVILGAWLLHEPFKQTTVFALALIVSGTAVIRWAYRTQKKPA